MRRLVAQILFTVIVGTLAYGFFEITGNSITEQQHIAAMMRLAGNQRVKCMAVYGVTGCGLDSYIGVYNEAGVFNGRPYYKLVSAEYDRYLFWQTDGEQWALDGALGAAAGAEAYYCYGGGELPGTWAVTTGTPPAPTVEAIEAPPSIPPTIAITSPLRSELSTAPPWVAGTVDLVCSTVEWGEEDPGLITDDAIEQVTWYTTNHGSPADSVPVTPVETVLSQGGTELLATTLDTTQFTPGSYISIRVQVEYDDTLEGYPAWAPSIVEAETAILVGNPIIAEPLT
jgi:hypothetical protein